MSDPGATSAAATPDAAVTPNTDGADSGVGTIHGSSMSTTGYDNNNARLGAGRSFRRIFPPDIISRR